MDIRNWLRAQWDRALAVVLSLVGAVALFAGYSGVKDALYPGQQIPYILSGGIFGLFLIGIAAALWLSADLRDEWRKLDEMDNKLTALLDQAGIGTAAPAGNTDPPAPAGASVFAVEADPTVVDAEPIIPPAPTGNGTRRRQTPLAVQ